MNLNDRKNQERKETEPLKKKAEETQNSSNTTQSLKTISKLKEVIESLKKTIEEKNQTIDLLHSKKEEQEKEISQKDAVIAQKEEKISELSLNISTLMSEIQKKSEQIEKLNSADLILKENENLKEKNKKLEKENERIEKRCSKLIFDYESEYETKMNQAANLMVELKYKKEELKTREENFDIESNIKAQKLTEEAKTKIQQEYDKKANDIEWKYKQKKNAIYSVTTGAVIYGFVITVYKMLSSARMRSDLGAFFKGIYNFVVSVFVTNKELLIEIWTSKGTAENSAGSIMIHIVLTLLLIAIQLAIAGFAGWGIYVLVKWLYDSDKFDFVIVMVMLISIASIVWIADKLPFIDWNLVVVWLVIQFGVIVGRGIVENVV